MPLLTNKEFLQRAVQAAAIREQERDTRRFDRDEIAAKIKQRVIGQDVLADAIAAEVTRKAARKVRTGTLLNLIISGPTGTGKTELAKAIAYAVFGEGFLLEIDCGTLGTSENALHSLVGSPAVYKGSSRGKLQEFLTKTRGDGVILFDEYEKAAPNENAPLAKALLRLLDEGRVQSQFDSEYVSAHGCIVILSSNLKQQEFAKAAKLALSPQELDASCRAILTGSMSPEFIGRFNMVVAPSPLNGEQRVSIGLMMIDKLAQMHGIDIVAPQAGLEQLAAICDEQIKELGVRRARHWLENLIEDSFIEAANERHLQAVAADWDGTALILSHHR